MGDVPGTPVGSGPDHDGVMRVDIPYPFADDRFPDDLAAAAMKSVLEGRRPCLQVVHFATGHWGIADGLDTPGNRNLVATHMRHVLDMDHSIAELATLPPGHQADRDDVGADPGLRDRLRLVVDVLRYGDAEATRRFERRFGPLPSKRR